MAAQVGHTTAVFMWWFDEIAVPIASATTAVSVLAKSAIERRADVRQAEIEAGTRRLEIEAETERIIIRETAETERERHRSQGLPRID